MDDFKGLLKDVEARLDRKLRLELEAAKRLYYSWVVRIVQYCALDLIMDLWITLLGCLKQILNVEECLTRILCLLDDGIDVLAAIIPWRNLLDLDLYLEPKVSQMTR